MKNKKDPIIINMPDHPDESDMQHKKPGSDVHHSNQKQDKDNIKGQHDKVRKGGMRKE